MNIKVIWEEFGPVILGLISVVIYWKYGLEFFEYAGRLSWKIGSIYSSVFDLESLVTAFIFGFFTFARTSETKFLFQMRKTNTYKRFMNYLLRAMYSSALLVLFSVPFLVIEPVPVTRDSIEFWLCAIWLFLLVYSLSATVRSMRQFIAIAMVERDDD